MTAWISVRDLIPTLPVPPYFVAPATLAQVRSALREAGFKVFEADAGSCLDERCLLLSLGDALGFPDYFGGNWNAFHDCMGDLPRESAGRIAVLIMGVDSLLRSDLHAFVRSVAHILDAVREIEFAAGECQVEFFFVGVF